MLGATSPLQAMYARARFDARDLGLLMGLQGVVVGAAGGRGPILGGLMHDLTGSWTPTVLLAVAALAFSTLLLGNGSKPR